MTLDDWKTMTPEEEQQGNLECSFCGAPIHKGRYCSDACKIAEDND